MTEKKLPKGLTFDADTHTYLENDIPVTSVTQFLGDLGFGPQGGFTSEAMQKGANTGNIVHKDYENWGIANSRVTTEGYEGYGDAFERFLADHDVKFVHTERVMVGDLFGVRIAGTVDLIATVDGELCIIDYKTSKTIQKYYALQLVMYAMLFGNPNMPKYVLKVMANGQYAFVNAETIMPNCGNITGDAFKAFLANEEFKIYKKFEKEKLSKKWFDLKMKEEKLKKQISSAETYLKKAIDYPSGGDKYFTYSYKRPSITEKFELPKFIADINSGELYTGSEIFKMIGEHSTVSIGKSSSFSFKKVKQEEPDE